jgi:hypothetical protein
MKPANAEFWLAFAGAGLVRIFDSRPSPAPGAETRPPVKAGG